MEPGKGQANPLKWADAREGDQERNRMVRKGKVGGPTLWPSSIEDSCQAGERKGGIVP